MNQLVLSVLVVGVLPFVLTAISKSKGFTMKENEHTRLWQAQLSGWQQRAHWAHQNAFETFPLFAVLAILAYMANPASPVAPIAAWTFVALRVAHGACYIAGAGRLRSTAWMASQCAQIALVLVAMRVV